MNVDALPASPFTLTAAQDRGIDRHALRRLVDGGGLRCPLRGVYVPTGPKDSVELRAQTAACVVPENHVLVDRTAAWLHGLNRYALGELVPPIETCALRGRNPTRRRELRGRTRDLSETDIMEVLGVRVTTHSPTRGPGPRMPSPREGPSQRRREVT